MKKSLILCLVVVMTSVASAVPYFAVSPIQDFYRPSDWMTIELYDDNPVPVAGFAIDGITDNTGGCVLSWAGEPQYFDPSFTFTYPGNLNVNCQLVEFVGGDASSAGVPAGTLIYSFEYHVPDVPPSTISEIQTDWDYELIFPPRFDYVDGTYYEGAVEPVYIHVVPEPATLALLGLGGLLLRRHK